MRTRDKRAVSLVRNRVCSACHMGVPIGTITVLMRGTDIQLCGNCGRYLHLVQEAPAEPPAPLLRKSPRPRSVGRNLPHPRRRLENPFAVNAGGWHTPA